MFRLIASYPKSGNTYVRIFLANYLRGETDLNKIGWPLFCSNAFFPIGLPKNRSLIQPFPEIRYAKTHEVSNLYSGRFVDRAIYIVRNPLDVCPSFSRHMAVDLDKAIKGMGNASNHLQGTTNIYPQYISDWSNNVLSWMNQKKFPVFFIRYETLSLKPEIGFKSMLEFLGVPIVAQKFINALDFSNFQTLKSKEEKSSFKEARGSTGKFFNVGRPGNGKEVLSPEQIGRIMDKHGRVMKLLNYGI